MWPASRVLNTFARPDAAGNARIPRLAALLALWLLLATTAPAQNMVTAVVPAGFRSADELAAILRPLIPPPGSISGFHNQLVIKTTAENLAELRQLLARLDRAPANLLVSVRHTLDAEIRADLAQAKLVLRGNSGRLRIGTRRANRAHSGVSVRGDGISTSVELQRRTITDTGSSTQRVRVLEGSEAFIRTGESVPISNRQVIINRGGAYVSKSTRYEEFGSGFWTIARLNGDHVTLDINPERRRRRRDGSAAVQRVSTSVSGFLGRWMEIGGVNTLVDRASSAIGSSRSSASRQQHSIYVKVDRLD